MAGVSTERVSPVGYFPQGEGRFAIVASNGGSPAHPDWYYNLKAHPRITVEVGTQTFTVLAEELGGTDFVSLNIFAPPTGEPTLRPCEMPLDKVTAFVLGAEPEA